MNKSVCPGCLKQVKGGFCLDCRALLFGGRKIGPHLPFSRPDYNHRKLENVGRISISGVQPKHSLKLAEPGLELTEKGGEYILKPIPSGELENLDSMPANEQVTMQIARQVFGLSVAPCAVVFFAGEGSPAYLTKRFDVLPQGTRLHQEDFAQIAQVTQESHGRNYKYDFSYEKIAMLMKRHVSAYAIEVEKFFKLVIFNYLVHNGDAHLKNFSLYRDPVMGAYFLTPAYDLLNTRLHLPGESAFALDLFEPGFETESHKVNGYYAQDDFFEFGVRLGIPPQRVKRFIDEMSGRKKGIEELLEKSFLKDSLKVRYAELVADRINALRYSFAGTRSGPA